MVSKQCCKARLNKTTRRTPRRPIWRRQPQHKGVCRNKTKKWIVRRYIGLNIIIFIRVMPKLTSVPLHSLFTMHPLPCHNWMWMLWIKKNIFLLFQISIICHNIIFLRQIMSKPVSVPLYNLFSMHLFP